MLFQRVRNYGSPDDDEYGFAFIRWTLNVIGFLMVSVAIVVIGIVIIRTMYLWA